MKDHKISPFPAPCLKHDKMIKQRNVPQLLSCPGSENRDDDIIMNVMNNARI